MFIEVQYVGGKKKVPVKDGATVGDVLTKLDDKSFESVYRKGQKLDSGTAVYEGDVLLAMGKNQKIGLG